MDTAFYEYNPWLDLSHAHIEAGEPEKGLKVLRELIQMSPRVKHKTILARALFQNGAVEEARLVKEAISDEEATFYMQRESHGGTEKRVNFSIRSSHLPRFDELTRNRRRFAEPERRTHPGG